MHQVQFIVEIGLRSFLENPVDCIKSLVDFITYWQMIHNHLYCVVDFEAIPHTEHASGGSGEENAPLSSISGIASWKPEATLSFSFCSINSHLCLKNGIRRVTVSLLFFSKLGNAARFTSGKVINQNSILPKWKRIRALQRPKVLTSTLLKCCGEALTELCINKWLNCGSGVGQNDWNNS